MKITTARRISQTFFFALFIWFCIVATVGTEWFRIRGWCVNLFLWLDPLVGLSTALTTHTLYYPLLFGLLGLGIGIVSRCFGIGGGFLLVPAMTTLGALPMYVAVPISLIGTSFSSIGSFIGYMMNGYWPDLWLAISIIIGGFVGGMLGSRLQKLFSEIVLKWALAITLFFLFFRFFKIEIWI